jgi:hypothetical protein
MDSGFTVSPSWEGAPWADKVQTIINVTAKGAIACCVVAFLVGAASMGVGRVVGSYQAGTRGLHWLMGGAGGLLVIGSTASIVSWFLS